MMKNATSVQRLLKGSNNIDRMKSEINQLIRMLISLCNDIPSTRGAIETFGSGAFRWEIIGLPNDSFRVRGLWTEHPEFKGQYLSVFQLNPDNQWFRDLASVNAVYDALPDFLAGIEKFFPGIAAKLRPITRVSGKFD